MPNHSPWMTNADWDAAAQEAFWKGIKRLRANRSSTACRKASALWATGEPDKRNGAKSIVEQLGYAEAVVRFALAEGDIDRAEAFYRSRLAEAIASDKYVYAAQLSLAPVLARSPSAEKRQESRALFDTVRTQSGAALLSYEALEAEYVPDPKLAPRAAHRLDDLAECFVMIHFQSRKNPDLAADDDALEEAAFRRDVQTMDGLLARLAFPGSVSGIVQPNRPSARWTIEYCLRTYVPAMGAWLGEIAARGGGEWVERSPLLASRVRAGGVDRNPFLRAYDTVFYEAPLTDWPTRAR